MSSAAAQRVPLETVQGAVNALLKWRDSNSQSQKPKLFDQDEEFVYLVLTLKKIPQKGRVNPYKVPLPHTLASPFYETCLIIDDRPKSTLTKQDAQKKIKAENVAVSKILKLSKLASDYRPFEAKRKLCDSYDMFFVDKRVATLLPRLLGKKFFKKKKIPVQVDLRKKNWKEQMDKACSSALFFVGTGTCSVVRVARVGMERNEIVENLVAAIEGIIEVVPKKWANVRSLHVKLLESLALPVYQAVPDVRLRIEAGKGEEGNLVKKEEEKKEQEEGKEVSGAKAKEAKKKKKGRIHEVRYMDSEVGEDHVEDEDEDGDNDEGIVVKEDSEDDENGSGESGNKRKKGAKNAKGALSELIGVKRQKKSAKDKSKESGKKKQELVSVKVMKENSVKQSRNSNLSTEDGESGKKTKKKNKSGVLHSDGADMKKKVNPKRSKKAA